MLFHIPFACILIVGLAMADPPIDENMTENIDFKESLDILHLMKERGWSTEGLTTMELGPMTVLQRNGNFVGYCVVESKWRPIPSEKLPLSNVTRIAYGDPFGPGAMVFTIEDPKEISLWVAAYRNHSISSDKNLRFIALRADAGFQNSTIKVGSVGHGCGCHKGIYFYNGDKEIRRAGGHWDEATEVGKLCPNEVLKALVCDRMQKERAKSKATNPEGSSSAKPMISPNSNEAAVEQRADGKTPEAPQSPH